MDCSHVLVTVASHDGRNDFVTTEALLHARDEGAKVWLLSRTMGLAQAHNECLCQALNMRECGITHWLNLHSDVGGFGAGWVGRMLGAMNGAGLQVMSAVVPFRDDSGLTSTAIATNFTLHRLTMGDVRKMPEVIFPADCNGQLLVNTGCMLWELGEWSEQFTFSIETENYRGEFGQFRTRATTEDWSMSQWLDEQKIRYGAYSGLMVSHAGRKVFKSELSPKPLTVGV